MQRQIKAGLVEFREDHTEPPFRKAHLRPVNGELEDSTEENGEEDEGLATQVRGTYFYKQSQVAVKYLRKLMGDKVFNNPKDHVELARLIRYVVTSPDAIVLDFFAGSGSFGEALFEANRLDKSNRRLILVQLPEELCEDNKDHKAAIKFCDGLNRPRNIAEICKERLRRAGDAISGDVDDSTFSFDVGFRVLKVASSNMKDVYYTPDSIGQKALLDQVDNIKEDRTPEDLLFQIFLDWGVDLSLPIASESIEHKTVFFVDENALAACFDKDVSEELVTTIAQRKPLRAVFRDSGFGSDSTKINVEQIFKAISPETEVKSI